MNSASCTTVGDRRHTTELNPAGPLVELPLSYIVWLPNSYSPLPHATVIPLFTSSCPKAVYLL